MHRIRTLLAVLLCGGLLTLCGCGGEQGAGNAQVTILWPAAGAAPTDLGRVQSVSLTTLNGNVPKRIVNRLPDGANSTVWIEQIPAGTHPFRAEAFDKAGGEGSKVGQAVGKAKIVKDGTTLITLTTVSRPGVKLSILSDRSRIEEDDSLQLEAALTNPDGSTVFYLENSITWKVNDTALATIDRSGRLQARRPGVVRVTAADPRTGVTTTAAIRISGRPPTARLTADRLQITPGERVILYWQTERASRVWMSNAAISPFDLDGILAVYPRQTTTYTLTAEGPGGAASDSVTVFVRK
ncbi:MAG: Ig-like domain-containing protein [Armatimonadota bacterium]